MDKKEIYAYYFPNWHVDKLNEKWHGKGWTEWEVTKCARARFENHHQPLIPLWGYEDEADPKVMEKKISTAKNYGIDGFIFDMYYYEEGPYRCRCIDEGFLKAENCNGFKFAIMWCNHDPIYAHPTGRIGVSPSLMSSAVTKDSFKRITDVFIEKYFCKPNYIRVDGKILFIIYNVEKLIRELGGVENVVEAFDDLRSRVRKAGLGELELGTLPAIIEDITKDKKEINDIITSLGIDMGVRYWWPVKYDDPRLTVEYDDFWKAGLVASEDDVSIYDIPMVPHMMNGLDQSPRTIQSETYENLNIYPWYAIVVGCTPENYEEAFKKFYEFANSPKSTAPFMTVIWNEWTEGNYLEPEEKYGYKFLEVIKRVKEWRK